MLEALARFYRDHHIDPQAFACPHQPACATGATAFTTAKASYVGPEYDGGRHPRLLFLSLDSGSADPDPSNRTLAALRASEARCDVDRLPKNQHWYLTHELAWVLLHRHVPGLTVATSCRYFAHVNSAKCCQNHPGRREADRTLFDNCRKFVAPELVILQPDIIVTQGAQARTAVEAGFAIVGRVGGDGQVSVIRCGQKRSLWIHTHHPSAYGLFHAQRRASWASYADAVERFLAGTSLALPAAPTRTVIAAQAPPKAPPTAARPMSAVVEATPRTIDDLIAAARVVTSPETFDAFVAAMRQRLPGTSHPYVGVLSGMRVQQFQNWQLDENVRWRLTDAQLLAVMRLEFPLATAKVFTADVHTGLRHVAGIRAHYNRDGHNGPSPAERGLPPSRSYGLF